MYMFIMRSIITEMQEWIFSVGNGGTSGAQTESQVIALFDEDLVYVLLLLQ
jgi:hypothetical protein